MKKLIATLLTLALLLAALPAPVFAAGPPLNIDTSNTPPAQAVLSGTVQFPFLDMTLTSTTDAPIPIDGMTFRRAGIALDSDVENIKVFHGTTTLATVRFISNPDHYAIFEFGNSVNITTDGYRITLYSDVALTAQLGDSVTFELVSITSNGTEISFWGGENGVKGNLMTVVPGPSLNISCAPDNPQDHNIVKGASDVVLKARLTVNPGGIGGAQISSIPVSVFRLEDGNPPVEPTDVCNLYLLKNDLVLAGPVSVISDGLANFQMDWQIDSPADIAVRLDVPTNSSASDFYVSIRGMDIVATSITTGLQIAVGGTATGNVMTVVPHGSLAVSTANTPPPQNLIKGSEGNNLIEVSFVAGPEEGSHISLVMFNLYRGSGEPCSSGDIANARLSSDGMPLGSVASPSNEATFAIDMGMPVSGKANMRLLFDIPSTSGADSVYATLFRVDAVGLYSATTIPVSGLSASGNTMYLFRTLPTVALHENSPSGPGAPSSNEEVFRFTVHNEDTGFDLNARKIELKLSCTNTQAANTLSKGAWNLYKSTDLTQAIAPSTLTTSSNETYGSLTMDFVAPSGTVGSGGTNTYVLKGYTAEMNLGVGVLSTLTVSLENLYWDDGSGVVTNKGVKGLPLTGGTLIYSAGEPLPVPEIKVLYPNGGEEWAAGQDCEIRWESSPQIAKVDIKILLKEGESGLAAIPAESVVADIGTYTWKVPENFGLGFENFKVSIETTPGWGPAAYDESDDWFSILPKPWCAPFWSYVSLQQGDTGKAVWELQVALNRDPDTRIAETGPGSPGNETDYFGPLTKSAVVKFQEKYASEILAPWGLTEGTGFVGQTTLAKLQELYGCPKPEPEVGIHVLFPNGGEILTNGETYNITWESSGIESVNIWLNWSKAVGEIIASNVPASQGSFEWTVSENPGDLYQIHISANEKGGVSDESDNYFTIAAAEEPVDPNEILAQIEALKDQRDCLKSQLTAVNTQLAQLTAYLSNMIPAITIDAPTGAVLGEEFLADVLIGEVKGLDAANWDVCFDPNKLQLLNVWDGHINGRIFPVDIANQIEPGRWRIVQNLPGLDGIDGPGILAVLKFKVVSDKTGETTISLDNGALANNLAQAIPVVWEEKTLELIRATSIPGDANGDGKVNALDITAVERIIAGLIDFILGK